MSAITTYLNGRKAIQLEQLKDLLKIPSVSTDPARRKDVKKAGAWVRRRLKAAGCKTVELHEMVNERRFRAKDLRPV